MSLISATPTRTDGASLDDAEIDRRSAVARSVFERATFRPGTTIEFTYAVEVTEIRPDRDTGEPTSMCWVAEDVGEWLHAQIADPALDDFDLERRAALALVDAVVANDVHEWCEFFHHRGVRVFDPHPNGRRWDTGPVSTSVRFRDDPSRFPVDRPAVGPVTYVASDPDLRAEFEELIATVCREVTFPEFGFWDHEGFEPSHNGFFHRAVYPDRDTGLPTPYTWDREIIDVYEIPADLTGPDATEARLEHLRAELLRDFVRTAAASITHEATEWLHIGGIRIFDPHPAPHRQDDLLAVDVRIAHGDPAVAHPPLRHG